MLHGLLKVGFKHLQLALTRESHTLSPCFLLSDQAILLDYCFVFLQVSLRKQLDALSSHVGLHRCATASATATASGEM